MDIDAITRRISLSTPESVRTTAEVLPIYLQISTWLEWEGRFQPRKLTKSTTDTFRRNATKAFATNVIKPRL